MNYFARWAWLPRGCVADVRIAVAGGRIVAVEEGARPGADDERLPGVVWPGLANTHSHAFHRALRGRTHSGGTFWTWREQMYRVAGRLTPDSYAALAEAVFAEMALSGVTCVGEFHYVHHQIDGSPYSDPNAMGAALIAAAAAAGIRITLLDACYLAGGLDRGGAAPLAPQQRRFGDGSVARWADRFAALVGRSDAAHVRIGAAVHSVRAVARADLPLVAQMAAGRPLHVHLSEQAAENEQARAAYACSPTEVLDEAGVLGADTTAVHATHVDDDAIARLARTGTSISICPTTERDLADGVGPARRLFQAGCPITLGSDQNAVIDLFEEGRALEMGERLTSNERGRFTPAELVGALTEAGHRSLGWPDVGRIAAGARADLVAVRLDSVRTAGVLAEQAGFAATAADVDTVVVDGRVTVRGGRHTSIDVAAALAAALRPLSA